MNHTSIRCYGVDFSGAGADNEAQKNIAIASAENIDGTWRVEVESNLSRNKLLDNIKTSGSSIWALDFPFSLPSGLARLWFAYVQNVQDVWTAMSSIPLSFVRLMVAAQNTEDINSTYVHDNVLNLVQTTKPFRYPSETKCEPKRKTDHNFGGQSCIHSTQPDMIPMVYNGPYSDHAVE
jgi:hypothetical protein